MNYFVMLNGICYLLAGGYSTWQGHYMWSFVWVCYGLSAMALSGLEGH